VKRNVEYVPFIAGSYFELVFVANLFLNVLYIFTERVSVEMMAWKYILLAVGVSIAAAAYWLYIPLPESCACSRQIQMMLAPLKVFDRVVGMLSVFSGTLQLLCLAKFVCCNSTGMLSVICDVDVL